MDKKHINKCANCETIISDADLKEVRDIFQRVLPGETMPSGECPSCGSLCFEEEQKAKQVTIHVWQTVPDNQLDTDDQQDKIAGKYMIDVHDHMSLPVAASIALDEFHSQVPISCLDNFEIACEIAGKDVFPSDDESYAHTGEGLSKVQKTAEYTYDGNRYSVYIQVPFGIRVNSVAARNQEEAVDKAFDIIINAREAFAKSMFSGRPNNYERFLKESPWIEYGEIAEDNFMAALVDNVGDTEYEDSVWLEPDPRDGCKMVALDSVKKETNEAIQQAIEALLNVPEVGEEYDQQHSDTHMAAHLRLKDLLGTG
ncbi:hypothetical protein FY034_17395 (plasmid) [Trichlorobacter lovleyi]|uniref:hypothetical protein n=1 Tax=Trichlorobacter lovleyi TaxID=313985 RepID=UPI002240AF29|nr:hypothetical protein [Trichlorobacter lovleyi]QOX80799.1 hypothetical protein FY034_17395 [Trichlorobacter lovleyi]